MVTVKSLIDLFVMAYLGFKVLFSVWAITDNRCLERDRARYAQKNSLSLEDDRAKINKALVLNFFGKAFGAIVFWILIYYLL